MEGWLWHQYDHVIRYLGRNCIPRSVSISCQLMWHIFTGAFNIELSCILPWVADQYGLSYAGDTMDTTCRVGAGQRTTTQPCCETISNRLQTEDEWGQALQWVHSSEGGKICICCLQVSHQEHHYQNWLNQFPKTAISALRPDRAIDLFAN